MLVPVFMVATLVAGAAPGPPLHYRALTANLNAVASLPDSREAIVIFWRPDCAPCVEEMLHLADYRRAAGATRIFAISLQPVDQTLEAAARLGISKTGLYATNDDPAETLIRFGGAPARLPLSVHLDGAGHVIASRHGLLGTDIVKAWVH